MDYLSYENTIPLVKATYFQKLVFHQPKDIHALIETLPDDPYGINPETEDPESDTERGPSGPKLTAAQIARLKPAAKALLLTDEKKTCAIARFVKETVFRELEPVQIDEYQNCAYQAILQQLSNIEYVFNTKSGEPHTATDLRNQVVYNMTLHADEIYPKLMETNMLPTTYKAWLHNQLDTQQPADEVSIFGMRMLLNVSIFTLNLS